MREEIFGPVAALLPAGSYDEALALANDTPFGLTAASSRATWARPAFARDARAGVVKVNQETAGLEFQVPFGGMEEQLERLARAGQGRARVLHRSGRRSTSTHSARCTTLSPVVHWFPGLCWTGDTLVTATAQPRISSGFAPQEAEREGFEPSTSLTTRNGFRDRRIRPLCHLSLRSGPKPRPRRRRRIRTLDGGIHPHNALAGRRLQPLGHFSGAGMVPQTGGCSGLRGSSPFRGFARRLVGSTIVVPVPPQSTRPCGARPFSRDGRFAFLGRNQSLMRAINSPRRSTVPRRRGGAPRSRRPSGRAPCRRARSRRARSRSR